MSTNRGRSWSGFWGRIPAAVSELPWLSAAEQTRLSWARRVETYDEVPDLFRGFFADLAEKATPFPYAVLTPSYTGFLVNTNEKLLCVLGPDLYILENVGDRLAVTVYPIAAINDIEFGSVLLKSWITINGRTTQGVMTSTTVKFNTVTDYLFAPFVATFRSPMRGSDADDLAAERAKFNHLGKTHFKFMNVAKKNILPGEHVVQSLLQPNIRSEIVRLFGRSLYRTITPAHIAVLTEHELIMIRDEEQDFWGSEAPHGSIKTYIPLDRITGCSVTDVGKDLFVFTVQFADDDRFESVFSGANRPALDQLVELLQQRVAVLG